MRRRAGLVAVVMVLASLAGPASASANPYTVTTTTDAVNPAGCAAASCSLRDAVIAADKAGGASTISVPAGTYALNIPAAAAGDPSNGDLDIRNASSVTIIGAGSGSTVIDAGAAMDRAFAVDSGASLALQGATVQNGSPASTSSGSGNGGAIYVNGALTLIDDVITASHSTGGSGGAVYDDASAGPSALTVRSTTFTSNTASLSGGAIADVGTGVLTLTGDTFGTRGQPARDGNTGGGQGGAVYDASSSAATIDDSTFTANQAQGSTGGGGALWLGGHGSTLDRDQFVSNASSAGGGAILWNGGALSSRGSSFVLNAAHTAGGAIMATAAATQPLSLTNVTADGNTAQTGGGLYFAASTPADLVNDTFYNDSARSSSGGNELYGAASVTANAVGVQNTIIGNDQTSGFSGPNCADSGGATPVSSGVDMGHNLATDPTCLTGAPGDKPNVPLTLSPPANNGGAVLTAAEPAGAASINAGTNAVNVCPGSDARGVSRPQGIACDIGAYEVMAPPSTTSGAAPAGVPPTATTGGVMGATATTAFLGGVVDPHGQATIYGFQFGTTRAYGQDTVIGHADLGALTVETRISGLKPHTLYHYRLLARSSAGTSNGADRTFRTGAAHDGRLSLRGSRLTVRRGKVRVALTCASAHPCVLRFSITISARLARTHKLRTLSFTRATAPLVRIPAHRTVTVSAGVNPAALALLGQARGRRLSGKLSTRPRSHQLGISVTVTLALG